MDVLKAVQEALEVSDAKATDRLDELGIDSIGRTEACMNLEDKFKVTISDDETNRFETVGDLVACVEARMK